MNAVNVETVPCYRRGIPSIEILCLRVDEGGLPIVDDLPFPVHVSLDRQSHRSPAPRFQADFDAERGALFHLGHPRWKPGTLFFAYELLEHPDTGSIDNDDDHDDHDDDLIGEVEALVFLPAYAPSVRRLLERLLQASPARRLLFTSDWQFGPRPTVRGGPFTLDAFWAEHDAKRLVYNAAYWIVAPA